TPCLPGGLGHGPELLGLVVAGLVGPDQSALDRDLNGIADNPDAGLLAPVLVAGPVADAGEADGPGGVDAAHDLDPHRRRGGLNGPAPALEVDVVVVEVALGMSGNEHPVVGDIEQTAAVLHLDRTAAELLAHVIAEAQHPDAA